MQPALIRLTQKFTIAFMPPSELLKKVFNTVYNTVISIMDDHGAENLKYYETHHRQLNAYKEVMENLEKLTVNILNKQFPEELPFRESKRLPLSDAKINILDINKESNKSLKFELCLTTEQLTLLETLPNGLLLAIGDCTKELHELLQIETFVYPCTDTMISTYQLFNTKQ
jgi:hypothetical protein